MAVPARRLLPALFLTLWGLPLSAQPTELGVAAVAGDQFGARIALSGDVLVIGAPADDERGADAGAVYVFTRKAQTWRLAAKLTAPDATPGDRFGESLALSGSTIAVGARGHNTPVVVAGAVYLFEEYRPGRWVQVKKLQAPEPRIGGAFGGAVALAGDLLLVGAIGPETEYKDTGGKAYLFARQYGGTDAWGLVDALTAPDGGYGDGFGSSVALSDSLVLVGAAHWYEKYAGSRAVYLFRRIPKRPFAWRYQEKLALSDATPPSSFGIPLALHDNRILVGLPTGTGRGDGTGSAFLYARHLTDGWTLSARFQASDGVRGDLFGASLTLDDSLVVIGAPGTDGIHAHTGAFYVFSLQQGTPDAWDQTAIVRMPVPTGGDAFGQAVARQGPHLIAGAPGSSFKAGTTYHYDLSEPFEIEPLTFHQFVRTEEGFWQPPVSAIVQDRDGFIWLGTLGAGLNRYDGYAVTSYVHVPADSNTLSSNVVLALLEDRQGRLWIGTQDGLNRLDRQTNRIIRYPLAPDTRYARQSVVALYEDRDGTLWTGTNGRLYRLGTDQDRFEEYAPFTGSPEHLSQAYISGIQQDRAGRLLVVAKNLREHDASLYVVDRERDTVTRYGLSRDWGLVGPLLVDSQDHIWVNVAEPLSLAPDRNGILHPSRAYEAPEAWALVEDRHGYLWAGTPLGFYRKHPEDSLAVLQRITLAPNQSGSNFVRSIAEHQRGGLLLGTDAGVYRSRPARAAAESAATAVPLVLSAIQVSNREGLVEISPHGLDRLELSHQAYSVAFEYAALTYEPPATTRYQYRLDGYDRAWVEAGTRRFAMYSNVPPGTYTFRVRATTDEAAGAHGELALPLTITSPFWKTWWFQGLVGALIAGLLVAAYRYRVAHLLAVERLRLRIASDLHDDLSSNLSGIALMSEMVQHQTAMGLQERRQLAKISQTARKMVEDLRDIVWFVDPGHDELDDLLLKMKDVAATMLQGIAYTLTAPEDVAAGTPSMEFRRHVLLLYKEILHNVVRHAYATHVAISIHRREDTFALTVVDDGVGFEEHTVQEGHGLKSLRARAAALDGTLRITSHPGAGTRVAFSARMA